MDISSKTNRVLHFISLCLILILIRVWYLSVVQHDYHVQQSKKPQRRVVIENANRAAIHDRFGIPLAVNKIQYNAAVCYANIRQIPSVIWEKGSDGKRKRIAARTEYIGKFAEMLSKELGVDFTKVEDIIHGKAALLPHTPFVIKEDISEEQYYRLRMLEKEWLGLQAQRASRRTYPLGKVGCDVIGYLGTMDQAQYFRIAHELHSLEDYLMARERNENPFLPEGFNTPEDVYARFLELQEKAYTMNDLVGKNGVEAFYEEDLRGYYGKRIYEIDIKGNCLQELPGSRKALSGKKVTLTISAELQDFSEKLLASIEGPRGEDGTLDENWMRGGAVVAMLPKTGEIVALASYPRFDPNDFIPTRDLDVKKEKEFAVRKWLENEGYIGAIWDGRRQIEREYFSFTQGKYIEEKLPLTWDRYLQAILPAKGALKNVMGRIANLNLAVQIQETGIFHPVLREIPSDDDRLLALDLCHLIAPKELFHPELISVMGAVPLTEYHADRQLAMQVLSQVKEEVQELFYDYDFTAWRALHFKEYLKEKREEERKHKRYAKPYTDYLDGVERKLFGAFWDAYKSIFLYTALTGKMPIVLEDHPQLRPYFAYLKQFPRQKTDTPILQKLKNLSTAIGVAYLTTFRSYEDLKEPLQNQYPNLRFTLGKQLERHLAAAFYPLYGYGFSRSQAYRQTSAQGSVFKLITAYQMMLERYQQRKYLNPLTMIDDLRGDPYSNSSTQVLGHLLDGTTLYRSYKGGRLPRSSHGGIGKVDLVGALEQSSNIYFALLASDFIQDPMNLGRAAKAFSLGQKTGIDLPSEARGNVPDDLDQNRTGLYSFAIGQHALEVTPLQTAVMLSTIANQGAVVKPHVVLQMEGPERVMHHEIAPQASLPDRIFSKTIVDRENNILYHYPVEIERTLPFPDEIFKLLTEWMRQVVIGSKGTARPAIMRNFYDHPSAMRDYFEVHQDLLAKTGTAQIRYKQTASKTSGADMKHHVWFAAVSYPKHHLLSAQIPDDPELVVVVFLRFRQAGREGGTIAGQVVNRWREIQSKH
jgi:cell division protein FtsI/penicillin-binding protein 2